MMKTVEDSLGLGELFAYLNDKQFSTDRTPVRLVPSEGKRSASVRFSMPNFKKKALQGVIVPEAAKILNTAPKHIRYHECKDAPHADTQDCSYIEITAGPDLVNQWMYEDTVGAMVDRYTPVLGLEIVYAISDLRSERGPRHAYKDTSRL